MRRRQRFLRAAARTSVDRLTRPPGPQRDLVLDSVVHHLGTPRVPLVHHVTWPPLGPVVRPPRFACRNAQPLNPKHNGTLSTLSEPTSAVSATSCTLSEPIPKCAICETTFFDYGPIFTTFVMTSSLYVMTSTPYELNF